MVEKILLIGRPSMGKTTIKKVIFEKENPNDLILFPLESTIVLKYSVYNFMDLKISLLDTAGQSFPIYLNNTDKQMEVFGDTTALIYVFDYNLWLSNAQEVLNDIITIYNINENNKFGAKIFLFFHKIDLIYQVNVEKLNFLKNSILDQLGLPTELPIYFTSLHPELSYTIYNAFFKTLSNFSTEASVLRKAVNELFDNLSKTICFITNKDDFIINQIETTDFNLDSIHKFHEKIHYLSQSENRSSKYGISKVIEIDSKFFYMALDNINQFHPNFKNIIILSETLKKEQLVDILEKLNTKLSKILNIMEVK